MPKILVIDDKPDNLVVVKAICKKLLPELEVVTSLSGKEGIELARQKSPDVILLDIIMPDLDGYDVCRILKADAELKIIPIILLTAILTSSEARVKGLEIGADAFLNKPVNENELIAQIKVMLRIKQAEDALRLEKSELEHLVEERTAILVQSEKRFRALYDNAPLSYQSLDEDGRFVDVNPTWLSTLGYDSGTVIGSYFKDYLHPDWRPHFEKNFQEFKRRGYVHDVQFKIRHHAGHFLDISFEGSIGHAADGTFAQTYCVFQDITERLKAEKALGESEAQFKRAITSSPIPIMIHDEKDNVIRISKGWTDNSGYTHKDIPTLSEWTRLAYGKADGTEKKYIDKLFEINQTTDNGEWQIRTKDGATRQWEFKTTPLGKSSNGLRLLLSVAIDITESRQSKIEIENALLEAKKANEVKDQFIANISHEIRTPLNSILGFSDLFKQRYSKTIQEKDQVIFDYITDSSERLMHTVDSILNMSMLKSGTISVHKEAVNLNRMTAIIVNNFKLLAEKKNLNLEFIESASAVEVFVDKNCINSAISNLTDNAIKYTHKGGITLMLEVIEERATLSICDTGIGISEAYQLRIFEPYSQESEGFTKEYQGVGLGLSITKQFLDLNDVDLSFKTEKNVGTTFKLIFPKLDAKENAKR
jgi:PAS domain S-box-containing protein